MFSSVLVYHLANLLNMLAWVVTDILWVRAIAVCGNALALIYYTQHLALYEVNIAWHITYISINLIQISVLLYQRRPIKFAMRELRLFRLAFVGLSPYDFKRLLRIASWHDVDAATPLAWKGKALHDIMIIVTGKALVTANDEVVSELEPGSFVGEMSFLHGGDATADVVTSTPAIIAAWNKHELKNFLRRNPIVAGAWQIGMGHDLAKKVLFHTNATGKK